jgi:mannose-6-phosphate isomerase-like protein (cupin superfamily)
METAKLIGTVVPPDGVRSVNVLGVQVDFLLKSDDTNGAFSTFRVGVEPGDGPPLHIHLEDDEAFYVLEGEFEFTCGDKVSVGRPGSLIYLPRKIPHTFRNIGNIRGYMLGIGAPAGHENFFAAADQLGPTPSPDEVIRVCAQYGMQVVAPSAP